MYITRQCLMMKVLTHWSDRRSRPSRPDVQGTRTPAPGRSCLSVGGRCTWPWRLGLLEGIWGSRDPERPAAWPALGPACPLLPPPSSGWLAPRRCGAGGAASSSAWARACGERRRTWARAAARISRHGSPAITVLCYNRTINITQLYVCYWNDFFFIKQFSFLIMCIFIMWSNINLHQKYMHV